MLYLYQATITPAAQEYLKAQYALISEMSEKALQSMEDVNKLSIKMAASAVEDSLHGLRQIVTSQDPYGVLSLTAAQAQPAAQRICHYQQALAHIAANTQLGLAKTAESHMENISRSAAGVADELVRKEKEQIGKPGAQQRSAPEKANPASTNAVTEKAPVGKAQ